MQHRYITKSRFKLALECPTKIFYDKKVSYANLKLEDTFLQSLANGGYQVGELAKCYFPGGTDIKSLNYDLALKKTNELMKQENAIIYEAAICFQNLFIRVDVLVKIGNHIDLIEVKAKSIDYNSFDTFFNKRGNIDSGWKEYLYDIAFQKYVTECAFPQNSISSYLMLADKSAACPTDGLNQKFRIKQDERDRTYVIVTNLSEEDLSTSILSKIKVDEYCDYIYKTEIAMCNQIFTFEGFINYLVNYYTKDEKIISPISSACGGCEFKANDEEISAGLLSGYRECWKEALGWSDADFNEPNIFELWDCRNKSNFIDEKRIKFSDILIDQINPASDGNPGISRSERQWLQIDKAVRNDNSYWIDKDNLKSEMNSWVYPLHFIDFETSMVAIPFNKGRHPYEGIAFQFSHHIVYEDGKIEHHGQYLNTTPGEFPNYEFVRTLKSELENDKGSIFRYSNHENTYLNHILKQLKQDENDVCDREALCDFIYSITKSVGASEEEWEGHRNMIDLWKLVKRYYYDPATRGSNSIKYVLPAILNSSSFLQNKYCEPIYGAVDGIKSLNYKDWTWIKKENGKVIDPYKLLPKMFQDISDKEYEIISQSDELKDGGAALTAYAKMQFEDMCDYERTEISKALLKYCELDTFAMVMIFEAWQNFLKD